MINNKEKEELRNKNKKEIKKENEDNKNNIINENKTNEQYPDNFKNLFGTEKSFAKVRIKPQKNICAFIRSNLLIIVSFDNKYYQAEIDLTKGGICKILTEKTI